ncbi:MAG: hypothetical protein ACI9YB_003105, partial [Halioglobus sp.]
MSIHVVTERITAEELIKRQQQQLEEERELRREENAQLRAQLDEAVNLIALFKEEIQQLKDEIAVLKGQKPRPKIPPSILEGPKSEGEGRGDKLKIPRGEHPRKKKKISLKIHKEQIVQPQSIPKGAIFKGYKSYDVQDIIFQSNNTRFLIARWKLSDGTYICG